jgi:hypothetical protein
VQPDQELGIAADDKLASQRRGERVVLAACDAVEELSRGVDRAVARTATVRHVDVALVDRDEPRSTLPFLSRSTRTVPLVVSSKGSCPRLLSSSKTQWLRRTSLMVIGFRVEQTPA